MSDTRLFFVVDSHEVNEELFETLEEAQDFNKKVEGRISICLVKHAYRDNGGWTYEDQVDTFEPIKEIRGS